MKKSTSNLRRQFSLKTSGMQMRRLAYVTWIVLMTTQALAISTASRTGTVSSSTPPIAQSPGQSAGLQIPIAPQLPLSPMAPLAPSAINADVSKTVKTQATKKKKSPITKTEAKAGTKAEFGSKKAITTLPAYKGKTKVAIDFEKPPEHLANQTRSALTLSLDQAIREQNEAEKNAQSNIAAKTTNIETNISDAPVISIGPKFKRPAIENKTTNIEAITKATDVISQPSVTKVTRPEAKIQVIESKTSHVEVNDVVTPSDQAQELSTAALDPSASEVSVENLTFEPRRHFPKRPEPRLLTETSLTSDTSSATTQSATDAQNIRSDISPAKKELDLRDGNWRFVLRGGYLHAPYSNFESRLQNGASHFALGLARQYDQLEIRSLLEIGHAMDQKVTIQNTRYVLARGEAAWIFSLNNNVQPFISGSLALGHFSVRSYRLLSDSEIVLKRHAQMTALGIAPGAGFRFGLFKGAAIDLTMEYLALAGSAGAKDLGGLNTSLSFSKTF